MSEFTWQVNGEIDIKTSGVALLNDYKRLLFENEDLKHHIVELEAKQRWIPVSERLPEPNQFVLVFDTHGDITIDLLVTFNPEGVAYYTNSDDGAVCWMTLPEPPEDNYNEPA